MMQEDPLSSDVQVLRNQPTSYRRRVGSYRIMFDIDVTARMVLIHDVLRRSTTTYRR
jgi:mRNA-degrading endonuclease RelE of RelBE toxin-antitoxin system